MTRHSDLRQELSLGALFFLAFGTIVGVGWVTVMGTWLDTAGPAGAALAFVAGGAVMVLIALCYAELASMFPVSGGEVAYAYAIFGESVCFLTGWFLALNYIAVLAFEAVSIGWIVSEIFPTLKGPVAYRILGGEVYAGSLGIGYALTIFMTYAQYRGVRMVARAQTVLTAALLVASAIFIALGLFFGDPQNLRPAFAQAEAGGIDVKGIGLLTATTFFWYAGFDVIPQAMGERKPGARLDRLFVPMAASIALAALFYVLVIFATGAILPTKTVSGLDLPVADAFEVAFGSAIPAKIVLLTGTFGLLTTWNAMFLAATRLLFSLGRARLLPAYFSYVSPSHGTPVVAIAFAAIVGAFLSALGNSVIGVIVNLGGMTMGAIFVLMTVGVLRLRTVSPDVDRPFRTPGGSSLPVLACAFSLSILAIAASDLLSSQTVRPEFYLLAGWSVLGMIFWVAFKKERRSVSSVKRRELLLAE
ncbi:MAG: APC family permease [Pseudomonadota bacterium]